MGILGSGRQQMLWGFNWYKMEDSPEEWGFRAGGGYDGGLCGLFWAWGCGIGWRIEQRSRGGAWD